MTFSRHEEEVEHMKEIEDGIRIIENDIIGLKSDYIQSADDSEIVERLIKIKDRIDYMLEYVFNLEEKRIIQEIKLE